MRQATGASCRSSSSTETAPSRERAGCRIPGNLVAEANDRIGDGRLLVTLTRKEFFGEADAAIFSFDTGSYQVLNRPSGFTEGVILPPDRLLFQTGEGIWLTDLAGNSGRLLLRHPRGGSYVFVSATRDGTTLYLDRSYENADIWEASPP